MTVFSQRYIVSVGYDWCWFIAAPLWALALGVLLATTGVAELPLLGADGEATHLVLLGVLVHAHLALVFVRSHGNGTIRRRFPLRFGLIPIALVLTLLASERALVVASVVATFWDVYHSGLQTFGLARVYEARAGNPSARGRTLDLALNHLLYAGPIVGGATMLDHFEDFEEFSSIGWVAFTRVPAFVAGWQAQLAWGLLVGGGGLLLLYLGAYVRWARQGMPVSCPKVALLLGTGACSIYSWGFNSFGEAFFIMNLFHAVQYFALVLSQEQHTITSFAERLRLPWPRRSGLWLVLLVTCAYGTIVELEPLGVAGWYELSIAVSLLHFWYDGFVWSVRRRDL